MNSIALPIGQIGHATEVFAPTRCVARTGVRVLEAKSAATIGPPIPPRQIQKGRQQQQRGGSQELEFHAEPGF
jgi:hypothetical protein